MKTSPTLLPWQAGALISASLALTTPIAAQPANDDCFGAINLTVNSSCSPTTGDVAGATQSVPAQTCGGFTGTADDDVWYWFTAIAGTAYVEVTGSAGFDAVVDVRAGPCNGVTIACDDATGDGGTEAFLATGLIVGLSYNIRVYDYGAGAPSTTTFTICVWSVVNDNCDGAGNLPVNGSCVPTTGNVAGASESIPALTCNGFTGTADDDVWFRFTATATVATIKVTGSAGFDAVVDLRFGPCPGVGIACADATGYGGTEVINVTGLAISFNYSIRVYDYGANVPSTTTFDICVFVPANDFCSGAFPLIVNSSCAPITGDVTGATESTPALACNGNTGTANDDVWFVFTATAATATIEVTGSAEFDAVVDLWAALCGGPNIACADATFNGGTEVINAAGLVPGTAYYVRVYDYEGDVPATPTFTICVYDPPPPTSFDCNNPVALALNAQDDCPANVMIGDNSSSPVTFDGPLCGTPGSGYQEAWYAFNSLASTWVMVYLGGLSATDLHVEVLDVCGGNSIFCDVSNPPPYIVPVTPATDYVVRVFTNTDLGVGGVFGICIAGDLGTGLVEGTAAAWSVFPNPGNGELNISFGWESSDMTIELLEATGRVLHTERGHLGNGTTYRVHLTDRPAPGTYTLRLTGPEGSSSRQVIVM